MLALEYRYGMEQLGGATLNCCKKGVSFDISNISNRRSLNNNTNVMLTVLQEVQSKRVAKLAFPVYIPLPHWTGKGPPL